MRIRHVLSLQLTQTINSKRKAAQTTEATYKKKSGQNKDEGAHVLNGRGGGGGGVAGCKDAHGISPNGARATLSCQLC